MKLKDLILNYLPMCLRKVGIYALIKVLLSPLVRIYETYLSWIEEKRKQVSYTGQQCMLRQIVKDELGVDIVISALDGKPYDFMVTIQGEITDTMRNRLTALIDKYKPGYKSWRYSDAGQDDIITYSAEWIEYVEQALHKVGMTVSVTSTPPSGFVKIIAETPVYADLKIKIKAHIVSNVYESVYRETSVIMKANETEIRAGISLVLGDRFDSSARIDNVDITFENSENDESLYYIKNS